MSPVDARTLVDQLRESVDDLRDALVRLWAGRAWLALGYETWDALCDAEFAVRIALPREQRAELVGDLRKQGMSTRAIGSALGVSQRTAADDAREQNCSPVGQREARAAFLAHEQTHTITGLDGKRYSPPAPRPMLPDDDDPHLRRLQLRNNFLRAEGRLHDVITFGTVPGLADALNGDDYERLAHVRRALNEFFDRLDAARPKGLRVITRG